MAEGDNHKRLDELVAESVLLLEQQNLLQRGEKSRVFDVITPWFSYNGNIDNILSADAPPETKAAIVFAASQYFQNREDALSRIGEALYRARQMQEGKKLSDRAWTELRVVWDELWNLGYRPVKSRDIAMDRIPGGEFSRMARLREKLDERAVELFYDIKTFYTEFGSLVFVPENATFRIKGVLEKYADGIVPEVLEKNGYISLDEYIENHVSREIESGTIIREEGQKLQVWIRTALISSKATEDIKTIDGNIEYIPPSLTKRADNVAKIVSEEHIEKYIVERGSRKLSDLVREGLGEQHQKRAAGLMRLIGKSPLLWVEYIDTTKEDGVAYVSEHNIPQVQRYIQEYVAGIGPGLFSKFASVVARFKPSPRSADNRESTKVIKAAEAPLQMSIYDLHTIGDYGQVVRLVESGQYGDEKVDPRLLAASASIRLVMQTPLSQVNQNKIWSIFKGASKAYVDLHDTLSKDESTALIIQNDISMMESFITGKNIDQRYTLRFQRQIRGFKEAYSGVVSKR